MAKPNYQFEKRQRDLRKRQKQEAKRQRKADAKASPVSPSGEPEPTGKPNTTTSDEKPGQS